MLKHFVIIITLLFPCISYSEECPGSPIVQEPLSRLEKLAGKSREFQISNWTNCFGSFTELNSLQDAYTGRYEGYWMNGEQNGEGKYYNFLGDGSIKLQKEGTFVDGCMVKGVYYNVYNNQDYLKEIGERTEFIQNWNMCSDFDLHGEGIRYHQDGRVEEGIFRGGKLIASKVTQYSTDRNIPQPSNATMHKSAKTNHLRNAFISLSKSDRISVQRKLQALSFYDSVLDGLYGKKTEQGLKAFNTKNTNFENLDNSESSSELIENILASQRETIVNSGSKEVVKRTNADVKTETSYTTNVETKLKELNQFLMQKEYSNAFNLALVLSLQGNAEAQYILATMYAEGHGTLQLKKNAHMWFNIASMNGHETAGSARNEIEFKMTSTALSIAEDMAFSCTNSKYTKCFTNTAFQVPKTNSNIYVANLDLDGLKTSFNRKSITERKQIQYALRELKYYFSSIDGIWGKGTLAAIEKYLETNNITFENDTKLFEGLVSEVDVPTSFAKKKSTLKTVTNIKKNAPPDYRNTGRGGWQPLSGNPKISYGDAKSICEPRAIAEGRYFQRTGRTRGSGTYSCTKYGFNSVSCRESSGGGYASGILKGLEEAMSQRDAQKVYEATAKACMAEYGWIKR